MNPAFRKLTPLSGGSLRGLPPSVNPSGDSIHNTSAYLNKNKTPARSLGGKVLQELVLHLEAHTFEALLLLRLLGTLSIKHAA